MSRPLRTFVAVAASREVRGRAAQLISELSCTAAKVRWVEPENLHFSLKFLGDVELLEIPKVCEAVARAVAGQPPFEIVARGAGAFPDADRPRTIWLGVRDGSEPMVELNAHVERELAPLGFRRERRRFRPHLTIGRVRDGRPGLSELGRLVRQHADFVGGVVSVDEVVVFSSALGRDGPFYEPLSTATLDGR
ncbi:MAG TPA: RNA 2',3'-cyclic phosphodiesterase [Pirellulales bacterium]|nr:RNA 2',3'-cyclic phosphodiesterase [Pirellulales bacterium]